MLRCCCISILSCANAMQAVSGGLEDSGDSAGQLGPNREAVERQQGVLRFSAHLALSLAAIGLVPPPHDMTAGVAYREMQARCTSRNVLALLGLDVMGMQQAALASGVAPSLRF